MVASPDRAARITRTESPRRFNSTQILPYVAVNKDAFPNSLARAAGRIKIIPPAKTSTGFLREFSSAISGFRSLCGRKQRSSLKPSRSIGPAFWNLSLGGGLSL
jgi:hypothetical protein